MKFLSKSETVAPPGFNRWMVPPAALAIHLCIGMAYGFSVFWIPLSQSIGITQPLACPSDTSWWEYLYRTDCDWPINMLGWIYTLFFVLLGSAAAIWGGWIEREGPRKAAFASAICWCGGLIVSAIGIYYHQLWLLWLGSGFIGGIGLGLGYISPISILIKWFPDHRGMATGMAIMGFGGGAMIGSPLANKLIEFFETSASKGVWETFCVLAVIYFVFMLAGALTYRVPVPGWKPQGFIQPLDQNQATTASVDVQTAMKTRQFWLLWVVLCMNVTAGIGIIGMASPLLQEIFGGKLIGVVEGFNNLNSEQKRAIAAVAAGFTGLLSLFNILGRFFWSTLSDRIGRKNTYSIFFALGCSLYCAIPTLGNAGKLIPFVAVFCLILSMYGGGFATIPAYLADLFGTKMVSAIHGRLLTAWSTAGVLGPVLVNYIREFQLASGTPMPEVYNGTMYLLGGLLLVGLAANFLIKPLDQHYFKSDIPAMTMQAERSDTYVSDNSSTGSFLTGRVALIVAWSAVLLPLAWGLSVTIRMAASLFSF